MMTSQSNSKILLTFCHDCGCLQLREVTNQLQELFTKRSINPNVCGICSIFIKNENSKELDAGDYVIQGKQKGDKETGHKIVTNNDTSKPGVDGNVTDGEWQEVRFQPGSMIDTAVMNHGRKDSSDVDETNDRNEYEEEEQSKDEDEEHEVESNSKISPVTGEIIKHNKQRQTIKTEPRSEVCTEMLVDGGLSNQAGLHSHSAKHAVAHPYKCDHPGCNKTFKKKKRLRAHIMKKHKENQFRCSWCGVRCTSKVHLNDHEKSVHLTKKQFTCSHCGKNYSSNCSLILHVKRVHLKLKPHVCDKCGRAFADRKDLKSHMLYHLGEKPYKCDLCDYRCVRADYLSKHRRRHTGEKPYQCEVCEISFAQLWQIAAHRKKIHGVGGGSGTNTDSISYQCEHPGCERTFKSKHQLNVHGSIHKERQYVCSLCGVDCLTKGRLDEHQKTVHNKVKPYTCMCSHCGKPFSRNENLIKHVNRVHNKLRPHMCEKCGRAFADSKDLKVHMLYHTGEKPYKCDLCDFRCARADYLTRHRRKHTGVKPYHCEECNASFGQRPQYVAHNKKKHGAESGSGSNADAQQIVIPLLAESIPISSTIPSAPLKVAENVNNESQGKNTVQ